MRVMASVKNRVWEPLCELLKQGITPSLLAWSVALGTYLGVIPMLGVTTLLCTVVALPFRLNLIAIQAVNWLVYPLQFLLIIPFFRMGSWLFRSSAPMGSPEEILRMIQDDPWGSVRLLWDTTWHAVVVWALLGVVLVPLLQLILRHMLSLVSRKPSLSSPPGKVIAT